MSEHLSIRPQPMPTRDHADIPNIQHLKTYWESLAGGVAPERSAIDPTAIKTLLPYICIVEFEPDPFRVLYRLSGTKVDEINGFSLVGMYLDHMVKSDASGGAAHLLASYRRCCETGNPCFSGYSWPTRSGSHLDVKFAMFPLKVNGVIRQCIAIEDWEYSFEPIVQEAVPLVEGKVKLDK